VFVNCLQRAKLYAGGGLTRCLPGAEAKLMTKSWS